MATINRQYTETERTSLITTAATMAGPVGESRAAWDAQVRRNIRDLIVMFGENSTENRIIDEMTSPDTKRFVGTVAGVDKERTSTRAIVGLATKPSEKNPSGVDLVRTERTDSSEEARAMANFIGSELIGHRVLVFVEIVEMNNSNKVRILRHVVDLGEDTNPDLTDDRLDDIAEVVTGVANGRKHKDGKLI